MPEPRLLHPEPLPCGRPLLTHSNTQRPMWLSLHGASGSWCAQGFVWALWVSLAGLGFDSKCDFAPPTILLGLLLCPWMWGIFFGGIQHSPADGCSAVSCNFGVLQEKMSACPCTLPSWICQKLICSIYKRNLSLPKHRKFTSKLKVCQFFSKNIKDRIKLFCLRLIQ